jgi:NADH pyrophosphatase NudC (nudix superfamily)
MGGFWELTGGKIETGETPEEALIRELKEEMDIGIDNYFGENVHSYDTITIKLIVGGISMEVTDFKAYQKWVKLPKNIQKLLINNVFCSNCGVTTIVQYTVHNDKAGIVLKGKCKKCGYDVARFVEDE